MINLIGDYKLQSGRVISGAIRRVEGLSVHFLSGTGRVVLAVYRDRQSADDGEPVLGQEVYEIVQPVGDESDGRLTLDQLKESAPDAFAAIESVILEAILRLNPDLVSAEDAT
jgi:hypothetical protein